MQGELFAITRHLFNAGKAKCRRRRIDVIWTLKRRRVSTGKLLAINP